MNFNTNQTRNFYVAKKLVSIGEPADAGDIALGSSADGKYAFFKYVNADGLLSRCDLIPVCNITSLKKTKASEMARKLQAHTIAIDTNAVTLSSLVGKTLKCTVTFHGFTDYDEANTLVFMATVVGNATNTASDAAFHKALAIAIAKALPKPDKQYPLLKVFSNGVEVTAKTAESDVTGAAAGVVLVEAVQKFVRGKLTGEPVPFSVSFSLADSNLGDIVWGTDTVAASTISGNTVVPAGYVLADLEYFALGERGDIVRGSTWPHNYEPAYMIAPTGVDYNVLSVEFFWQGGAENVQKSPRMIQVAAPASESNDIVEAIYDALYGLTTDGAVKDVAAAVKEIADNG